MSLSTLPQIFSSILHVCNEKIGELAIGYIIGTISLVPHTLHISHVCIYIICCRSLACLVFKDCAAALEYAGVGRRSLRMATSGIRSVSHYIPYTSLAQGWKFFWVAFRFTPIHTFLFAAGLPSNKRAVSTCTNFIELFFMPLPFDSSVHDSIISRILIKYRPLLGHLSLRGCSQLTPDSLKYIGMCSPIPSLMHSSFPLPPSLPPLLTFCLYHRSGQCQNLQDLNLSECTGVNVSIEITLHKILHGAVIVTAIMILYTLFLYRMKWWNRLVKDALVFSTSTSLTALSLTPS